MPAIKNRVSVPLGTTIKDVIDILKANGHDSTAILDN
jgi:hypothetical protein